MANGSSYAVSSNLTLFNGLKLKHTIDQNNQVLQASEYDLAAMKESIGLNVLNAFLQLIYSKEQVNNDQKQVDLSKEQMSLAEERFKVGAISKSDYLSVKSQWASETQTLVTDEGQKEMNRVALMQLLEIPVNDQFDIKAEHFGELPLRSLSASGDSIYQTAVISRPEIQSATSTKEAEELGVKIARSGFIPSLTMSASVSTGFNNPYTYSGFTYANQLSDRLNPSVSFTLSIPIYNNYQEKAQLDHAKISRDQSDLDLTNTKNTLRKSIEQAVVNAKSANRSYEAAAVGYQANQEAYSVSAEKYVHGLINAVDLLVQKTSLINAESKWLQAKYNLIFSYKILDFYQGIPLTY